MMGVGNGLMDMCTALLKRAYFSGGISGVLTLITGALTLSSIAVHL
jgi:hypothetical protein